MDIREYLMPSLEEKNSIGMEGREEIISLLGTIINSTGSAIHLSDKFIASIKALTS